MRQMVAEIHQGKLNIAQAAAKFETTRKTVQHWMEIVEEESERRSDRSQRTSLGPATHSATCQEAACPPHA